jgi:uncharacterized membrane protein YhaH (DUF805 family)
MRWMLLPLRRYADFRGRSRRREYWLFILFNVLMGVALVLLGAILTGGFGGYDGTGDAPAIAILGFAPFILFYLAVLVPSIAVQVRRLHDRGWSGWWLLGFYLLSWVPVLGLILSIGLIVVMCLPGTAGPNRFGPDPKEDVADAFR